MGLYDNYKVSLSNTVRPFAGSVIPELRQMKSEMDAAAYKTLDTNLATQDLLATTPTLDLDKEAYNAINDEAQDKITKITESGNLANSVVDAYTLAHQTTRKLNSLATRQKTMEEFKNKLNKDGVTPDVQEYLIAETERQNGPAKFDPRTQKAQPLVPVTNAKQLRNDEMVRQAVISTVRDKGYTVTDSDASNMTQDKVTGNYKIQTSHGIVEIPAADLMAQVDMALKTSKEWDASLSQDANSDAYHQFKNVTETEAKNEINNPTTTYGKRAQEIYQTENISARQALEKAASEQFKSNKILDLKNYAAGAASRNLKIGRAHV